MKDWNTDKIIGAGLILVLGNIAITLYTGKFPTFDLPMNIVTSLAGYMGRSLLEKQKKEANKNE